jgi:hypothetical protein
MAIFLVPGLLLRFLFFRKQQSLLGQSLPEFAQCVWTNSMQLFDLSFGEFGQLLKILDSSIRKCTFGRRAQFWREIAFLFSPGPALEL